MVSAGQRGSMCLTTSFLAALACTVPGEGPGGDPGLGFAGEVVHQTLQAVALAAARIAEAGPVRRPGSERSRRRSAVNVSRVSRRSPGGASRPRGH